MPRTSNSAGTAIFDSKALNGTTAVILNSAFKRVLEVYTGDLESTRTVTLATGAADVAEKRLGIVGTATTAQNQLVAIQFRG